MAGMLPGVELARRRRTHHHHESSSREPCLFRSSSRLEPTTALGEAALRARTRLEQKLRGGSDSRSDICSGATYQPTNLRRWANYPSTWSKNQPSKGGGSKKAAVATAKETHETVVRRETGYREDVCAVCLDEFRVKQQVMNLPCSHRYHSDCLLPWLNVHSYCPCCRTHVQS